MTTATGSLGQLGEDLGCRYLKDKGFRILGRNYRNLKGRRIGEIDIIARWGKEIVFVEVKTRSATDPDALLPEANISPGKLRKLGRIASLYLREHGLEASPYRFDALSILYRPATRQAEIRHLDHIFI